MIVLYIAAQVLIHFIVKLWGYIADPQQKVFPSIGDAVEAKKLDEIIYGVIILDYNSDYIVIKVNNSGSSKDITFVKKTNIIFLLKPSKTSLEEVWKSLEKDNVH